MKQAKKRQELTEQQQEFIRLLREKAEDTPVPMALQPEMILQRLPDAPPQKVGKTVQNPYSKLEDDVGVWQSRWVPAWQFC